MDKHIVRDLDTLHAIYGKPAAPSLIKEVTYIHSLYRPWIEKAPFVVLATAGGGGLDVSPRGDKPGFVQIEDEKTLLLPDRRGNNRLDSLRNLIEDDRLALLFLIPGAGEMLRINGRGEIDIAPALLARFSHEGVLPRSVLRIQVESVYFQCSRAALRSGLWQAESQIDRHQLPSPGAILKALSRGDVDGAAYDALLPQRLKNTLY
ncbi:flavin-nucleotide-binding protein [Erwinia sp. OLTSP20]|uniref:pyridoxamine 5'-phosphate oxidase family protein n=1 Tax=unclassified Erwinia TaxID=2622719 RepID=UPI000C178795|nr:MULTISPECIES: pyridoxamine 5'-phosphate oxidase family protein [unclassified Erwinia]PIJ48363.1 flavin-nucleotide-binding protein [Erwinia sp. OAMSP11]PIJ68478.1 flavin-nucleotide-binding protein [Erwinia sp. OLSSP12]PIJ78855.1 flavin-nucleotide-binding protein [Erwinia sp. OLCASP19]PIJ79772.1 flavin-nucleotide-binding protein [Erwinia sp. OLMTSP26]PIJ81274.1 flavin-nucleotide-binding protein [Erwinia sp. OLMDSP33]